MGGLGATGPPTGGAPGAGGLGGMAIPAESVPGDGGTPGTGGLGATGPPAGGTPGAGGLGATSTGGAAGIKGPLEGGAPGAAGEGEMEAPPTAGAGFLSNKASKSPPEEAGALAAEPKGGEVPGPETGLGEAIGGVKGEGLKPGALTEGTLAIRESRVPVRPPGLGPGPAAGFRVPIPPESGGLPDSPGFFTWVGKVRMSRVPGSAFSATAPPPWAARMVFTRANFNPVPANWGEAGCLGS